jgi:hypothetical protein
MKNVTEIRSGVLTHIKSFIKIISGIQNLIGGYTQTYTESMEITLACFFFKLRKVG